MAYTIAPQLKIISTHTQWTIIRAIRNSDLRICITNKHITELLTYLSVQEIIDLFWLCMMLERAFLILRVWAPGHMLKDKNLN